jgi:hypothetical protein
MILFFIFVTPPDFPKGSETRLLRISPATISSAAVPGMASQPMYRTLEGTWPFEGLLQN